MTGALHGHAREERPRSSGLWSSGAGNALQPRVGGGSRTLGQGIIKKWRGWAQLPTGPRLQPPIPRRGPRCRHAGVTGMETQNPCGAGDPPGWVLSALEIFTSIYDH